MARTTPATPTEERCVTSYPARRGYAPGVFFPPEAPNVAEAIDIHCHAHGGQQDAPGARQVRLASRACGGLLFKTITDFDASGRGGRGASADALDEWAEAEEGVRPIECWAGRADGLRRLGPVAALVRGPDRLGRRSRCGFPVFNHANTYAKVGGREIWWNPDADPARRIRTRSPGTRRSRKATTCCDEDGRLKGEAADIVRLCAERERGAVLRPRDPCRDRPPRRAGGGARLRPGGDRPSVQPLRRPRDRPHEAPRRRPGSRSTSPMTSCRRCWASTRRGCTRRSARSGRVIAPCPRTRASRCFPTRSNASG